MQGGKLPLSGSALLLHVKCLMGFIVTYTSIPLVPKSRLNLSSESDSLLWVCCLGRSKYDPFSGTHEPHCSSSNELQETGCC